MFVIFDTQFLSIYIPLIQFYGKRRQWKYETFIFSSFSDIHVHPNFQKIFRQIWWPQSFEVMWPFYRFGWSGDWSIFVLHPLLLSQSIMSYNGGAVMAMRGKNCVAIAADRRFGIQAQMVTTDFQKIFPMGDRLYIGLAGLATDVQTVWVGISSSQNVFFMPVFYLLCSESAHWFANFQLSFLKFEVKQNMLKEIKYKGKKWFFCVLSSCFILIHLHTRSLN